MPSERTIGTPVALKYTFLRLSGSSMCEYTFLRVSGFFYVQVSGSSMCDARIWFVHVPVSSSPTCVRVFGSSCAHPRLARIHFVDGSPPTCAPCRAVRQRWLTSWLLGGRRLPRPTETRGLRGHGTTVSFFAVLCFALLCVRPSNCVQHEVNSDMCFCCALRPTEQLESYSPHL